MSRRRRRRKAPPEVTSGFWGRVDDSTAAPERISPTPEPAALPRSLGSPPLAPGSAAAHLAVVYEEAVRTATALAAANGLLADDE
jgi:hypothetical protein